MISGAQDRTIQFRRLTDWDLAELDKAAKLTEPLEFVPDDLDMPPGEWSDVVTAFELGRQVGQSNSDNRYYRGLADGVEIGSGMTETNLRDAFRRPAVRGWARVRASARRRPGGAR